MPLPDPSVTSVSCTGGGNTPSFNVTWNTTGYPSTQMFMIGLFDMSAAGPPISTSARIPGSIGSITASVALSPSGRYQIRVATADTDPPASWPSNGPPALFVAPESLTLAYDGTNITATWTNPAAGYMPLSGQVSIAIGGNQYTFDLNGTGGMFEPAGVPLDPYTPATLTAAGVYGVSVSPPSAPPVTLIQSRLPLQKVDNGGTNPRTANGYAGGAALDYDLSSYLFTANAPPQQWTLGFDALLSQLTRSGAVTVQSPQMSTASQTEAGVAEAIDLYWKYFTTPFYRLFFANQVLPPSGQGSTYTPANFVLAASQSWRGLQTTVNCPSGSNATVAYFRGRTILKLCIRVFVNGVQEIVPVGTTVNNVLERYGRQVPSAAVAFTGVRLERASALALDATAPFNAGASVPVRLDWNALTVYGPAHDALSLPLLHGDRLTLG